jgi:glycosyltransferase involved in cell wall biosynthesis
MRVNLATYFYDHGTKYIQDFLSTVRQQTYQDFKLVVFNDGVKEAGNYFSEYHGDMEIVELTGTPTQIRLSSFEYLNKTDVDFIIFLDIDDKMSENRIEVLLNHLRHYDIVSNDLSLMNENGELYKRSIWSDKLKDEFVFDSDFIKHKNIVGIGNSGIRKSVLNIPISYSAIPKVGDWFIFYQIMYNGKAEALFTSQCQTFYRQHDNNMAGIKVVDENRLNYIIEVKRSHYQGLKEIGYNVKQELLNLEEISQKIKGKSNFNIKNGNLFWWDETNHISIN